MGKAEYSTIEIRNLLASMKGMYDLTRVVDPTECSVLNIDSEGHVSRDEKCYSVWSSEQRCVNCSSARACRTGCHREKTEYFQGRIFDIESNPVTLKMNDGTRFEAVVELISIKDKNSDPEYEEFNEREAENVNNRAFLYQARHDSLTGLLNAEAFYESVRARLIEAPDVPWAMVTGNIREFRLINNLFGVEKGNELLVRTAELLRRISDEGGGLCARTAGDHFALLIADGPALGAALIKAGQSAAGFLESGVYTLTVHFGICRITDPSLPVSVLCDRANMALHTIREDLTHSYAYFDEEMMRKSLFEQEVITVFDRELKAGRFRMFLQPLTRKDGTPVGAEALVRWIRSDGTIVPPMDYIGILEKAGLIARLDQCVWEQTVQLLSRWTGTEKEYLPISVNMSARDFYDCDIYGVLTGLLEKYHVDSKRLRLEITESVLLENPLQSNRIIKKLREAGFIIEIDDFGKGYSSLSMLKDIDADILKIDMEFLHETENGIRSKIILGSVIDMAHSLGMKAVTEGVETEKQLEDLSGMGCTLFQGYYFSRPIPVEEFEKKYWG